MAAELIIFNKPFRVLCQFTPDGEKRCLKDFIKAPAFYPAGRLDFDSEGLLLLTNNGKLQAQITQPRQVVWKRYYVQVECVIDPVAIQSLSSGVMLKDGKTLPARVSKLDPPDWLWEREPPIRFRKNIPTSWIQIEIHEGRNRQIRRMCAAVGYPVLRLVRQQVGQWSLGTLQPGEWLKQTNARLNSPKSLPHHALPPNK